MSRVGDIYVVESTKRAAEFHHSLNAKQASVTVEPVFANICVHKRMNLFTLRTKLKVDVQWTRTRFALVHHIGKIHTFGALPYAHPRLATRQPRSEAAIRLKIIHRPYARLKIKFSTVSLG